MFKRGNQYTRKELALLVRPKNPPSGGDWDTGYARIENKLFVFANIGIPGRTGHDFENEFDEKTNTLIWFSRPNKNSSQMTFKKLLSGEYTPYFFVRWDNNPPFMFLGTGSIITYQDGYQSKQGYKCTRMIVSINDLEDIIPADKRIIKPISEKQIGKEKSSFLFEKHLEDFIVNNWERTPLANDYNIFEKDGEVVGKQFPTTMGAIDILGQRKDKSDFLVIELKRDRASDNVVGQTLRYMGWIKEHLCHQDQNVTGCIIAQRKDEKLDYALKAHSSIQFMRFEVDFRLIS